MIHRCNCRFTIKLRRKLTYCYCHLMDVERLDESYGKHLGSKPVLPYLSLALTDKNLPLGANFASAAIEILNDMGFQFTNAKLNKGPRIGDDVWKDVTMLKATLLEIRAKLLLTGVYFDYGEENCCKDEFLDGSRFPESQELRYDIEKCVGQKGNGVSSVCMDMIKECPCSFCIKERATWENDITDCLSKIGSRGSSPQVTDINKRQNQSKTEQHRARNRKRGKVKSQPKVNPVKVKVEDGAEAK
nr:GDSL esterase/lipase At5g33370-like [Tanacetum cinerariifolium]